MNNETKPCPNGCEKGYFYKYDPMVVGGMEGNEQVCHRCHGTGRVPVEEKDLTPGRQVGDSDTAEVKALDRRSSLEKVPTAQNIRDAFDEGFEQGKDFGWHIDKKESAEKLRDEGLAEHARGESLTTLAPTASILAGSVKVGAVTILNALGLGTKKQRQ